MRIGRLFEIVYLLMNKKKMTAQELSKHFEVSHRTIYRDVEILCQSGIPIYTLKGRGGGICLMENFIFNKSLLSSKEQEEIIFALQGLKVTNSSDTDQVLLKLKSLFGNHNPDWIQVDFSNWSHSLEDKRKFSLLKEAILNSILVSFYYSNSKGSGSQRVVEPVKLIFKGQAWYLLGYCRGREAQRYFKLTRMDSLSLGKENFQPRPVENLIEDRGAVKTIDVKLKIAPSFSYRVYDEFPREGISILEDGYLLIHSKLIANNWLMGYLMSYEDGIEILEPLSLRNEFKSKLKNLALKYGFNDL